MANYYMMTDDDKNTFFEISEKVWIGWDAIENMTASEADAYCDEVKNTFAPFFASLPVIEGTRKAEVCAEACRRADAKGMTESLVVRFAFLKDCYSYHVEQSWFVCKEDGKWFQKMNPKCKAKHEVCL